MSGAPSGKFVVGQLSAGGDMRFPVVVYDKFSAADVFDRALIPTSEVALASAPWFGVLKFKAGLVSPLSPYP